MNIQFFLPLVTFLGLIAGIIINNLTKEEYLANRKYILFLSRIILSVLIIFLASISDSFLGFFIGLIIGFFLKATYLYLGLAAASMLASQSSIIVSSLSFLYGIPYGTLAFYRWNWKMILLHLFFFLMPFLFISWFENSDFLVSLSAGLLISGLENKFEARY